MNKYIFLTQSGAGLESAIDACVSTVYKLRYASVYEGLCKDT